MSPATQKLEALKGKRFGKYVINTLFFSPLFSFLGLCCRLVCVFVFVATIWLIMDCFRSDRAKGQSLFANTMSKNVGAGKDGEGGGAAAAAAESMDAREGEKK